MRYLTNSVEYPIWMQLHYSIKQANSMLLFYYSSVLFYCSSASLEVKGPTEPILEGQDVTLECLDTESELNMSTVHFERLSKVKSLTHNGKEISGTRCTLTCICL